MNTVSHIPMSAKTLKKHVNIWPEECRSVMAAAMHRTPMLYGGDDPAGDKETREVLFDLITRARDAKHPGDMVVVSTLEATILAATMELYNDDRKSNDRRMKPTMAVQMIATDMARHPDLSENEMQSLIHKLSSAVARTLED